MTASRPLPRDCPDAPTLSRESWFRKSAGASGKRRARRKPRTRREAARERTAAQTKASALEVVALTLTSRLRSLSVAMILRILATAAVLTGLAACGSSEPTSPPPRTAQKPVLCPDLRWTDGPSQRFDARTLVGLERERAERAAA